MKSITRSKIRKLKGGWRIANNSDPLKYVYEVEVKLLIESDSKKGFHLLITPDGFSTTDSHHLTQEEAVKFARESFNISGSDWS